MEVRGCYFVSGGRVGLTDTIIGVKEGTRHKPEREKMQEEGRASGKALKLEGFWRGVSTGQSPESCLREGPEIRGSWGVEVLSSAQRSNTIHSI